MSYIRSKQFGKRVYYYRVEGYRDKDGRVRQRVLEYLGTSPNHREIPVDPLLAGAVAKTLMSGKKSPTEIKAALKKMDIDLGPGKLKEIHLVFKPPPQDSHSVYRLNRRTRMMFGGTSQKIHDVVYVVKHSVYGKRRITPSSLSQDRSLSQRSAGIVRIIPSRCIDRGGSWLRFGLPMDTMSLLKSGSSDISNTIRGVKSRSISRREASVSLFVPSVINPLIFLYD